MELWRGTRRGFKVNVSGGATVLGTGGQGGIGFERGPAEQGSEATERIYDPLWSNALALLDYLESANLICRDTTAGRLGQFVLASGSLSVLNPTALPKLWESTHFRNQAVATAVEGQKVLWNANPEIIALSPRNRAAAEKAFLKTVETNSRAAMDLLPSFPHSAQCMIKGVNFSLWSSLSKQVVIPFTGVPSHFETMIRNISNLARTTLGRPPDAYGATALLLFREVSNEPI
jgi:hypothetical protein